MPHHSCTGGAGDYWGQLCAWVGVCAGCVVARLVGKRFGVVLLLCISRMGATREDFYEAFRNAQRADGGRR